MKINCEYTRLVPIGDPRPNPKNPNKHTPEQIARLAHILEYQGWRKPVVVSNLSGFVTSGHGRLLAALKNGWHEVPVSFQDYVDEAQEYADLVADNAIAEWASIDLAMINQEIPHLGPDFDIDSLGLQDFNLDPAYPSDLDDEEKADGDGLITVIVQFFTESEADDFANGLIARGMIAKVKR